MLHALPKQQFYRTMSSNLDGNSSHKTLPFLKLCYDNSLKLISFPSHVTRSLQPLDWTLFTLPEDLLWLKCRVNVTIFQGDRNITSLNFVILFRKHGQKQQKSAILKVDLDQPEDLLRIHTFFWLEFQTCNVKSISFAETSPLASGPGKLSIRCEHPCCICPSIRNLLHQHKASNHLK